MFLFLGNTNYLFTLCCLLCGLCYDLGDKASYYAFSASTCVDISFRFGLSNLKQKKLTFEGLKREHGQKEGTGKEEEGKRRKIKKKTMIKEGNKQGKETHNRLIIADYIETIQRQYKLSISYSLDEFWYIHVG